MEPVISQAARSGSPKPDAGDALKSSLLASFGFVAFTWDLTTDVMIWSDEAGNVLPAVPSSDMAQGAAFGALTTCGPAERRAAVNAARQNGDKYYIQYGLRLPNSSVVLWAEERGRVMVGLDRQAMCVEGILSIDAERHAREEALAKQTKFDQLTGALNRVHLIQRLEQIVAQSVESKKSIVFMLIGIDHLARINEAFGFDIADEVISEVARRIRMELRASNALGRSPDELGRFSGNKLGVILRDSDADRAEQAASRFLRVVREMVFKTSTGSVSVTSSIGAVSAPHHGQTSKDLVSRAQEALTIGRARRDGSFTMWRPSPLRDEQRVMNLRVMDDVVTALHDRRIVVAFEPVVHAGSRRLAFHECLVRLLERDGTIVQAPQIVPVAERIGMIRLIDHRVLELVVSELVQEPGVSLSLNLSPESTMDPDWWSFLETMIRNNPGIAERMIVEITESVAIQDLDDIKGFVARVKNLGARIAIDDFGAGYTSFSSLRKLGVDIVKIDGVFVKNILRSADDRAFVQTMIDLARRLEIKAVAEWVQDEGSAALLESWGCDYLQGKLIGLANIERPWGAALPNTETGAR